MSTKKRIRDTETKYGNLRAAALTHQKFTAAMRIVTGLLNVSAAASFFEAGFMVFVTAVNLRKRACIS